MCFVLNFGGALNEGTILLTNASELADNKETGLVFGLNTGMTLLTADSDCEVVMLGCEVEEIFGHSGVMFDWRWGLALQTSCVIKWSMPIAGWLGTDPSATDTHLLLTVVTWVVTILSPVCEGYIRWRSPVFLNGTPFDAGFLFDRLMAHWSFSYKTKILYLFYNYLEV